MHFPCWMAHVRLVTIVGHAYILFLSVQLYTKCMQFYKAYFEQHIDYVIEFYKEFPMLDGLCKVTFIRHIGKI